MSFYRSRTITRCTSGRCLLQRNVALFLTLFAGNTFSWMILPPRTSVGTSRCGPRWSAITANRDHPSARRSAHDSSDYFSMKQQNKKQSGTTLYSSKVDNQQGIEQVVTREDEFPGPTTVGFSSEELATIEKVFHQCEKATGDSDKDSVRSTLLEILPTLSPSLLLKLRQVGGNNDDVQNPTVQAVSKHINTLLETQLDMAKTTLAELLNAGEIRKLDALIGKASREGKLDTAFFNVLTLNLKDAADAAIADAAIADAARADAAIADKSDSDDDEAASVIKADDGTATATGSRQQILTHIYTRCQEEVEKTIPPANALLNKLLRTKEAAIRKNLYQHYLTVPSNIITAPDGSAVNLGPRPVLVPIDLFASAIDGAVLQIRNVETAGGLDRESSAMMVEACRQVAKEARIVIGESYGIASSELRQWEDALEPVFRPASPDSPYIKGQY